MKEFYLPQSYMPLMFLNNRFSIQEKKTVFRVQRIYWSESFFFKFKIKLHADKNTIKSHKHSISNSLMTGICKEEDGKIG